MTHLEVVKRFVAHKKGRGTNFFTDGETVYTGDHYQPVATYLHDGSVLVVDKGYDGGDSHPWKVRNGLRNGTEIYVCTQKEMQDFVIERPPVLLQKRRVGAKDIDQLIDDMRALAGLRRWPQKQMKILVEDELNYLKFLQAPGPGYPAKALRQMKGHRIRSVFEKALEGARRGDIEAKDDILWNLGRSFVTQRDLVRITRAFSSEYPKLWGIARLTWSSRYQETLTFIEVEEGRCRAIVSINSGGFSVPHLDEITRILSSPLTFKTTKIDLKKIYISSRVADSL